MPDAIELLTEDHRTVETLFEKIEATEAPAEKHELVQEAIKELVIHSSIEERVLYPVIREALPDGDGLIDEHIGDHAEVEKLLDELDKADPTADGYDQLVDEVIADVREHVEEEENETFPKLHDALSAERLQQIGHDLEEAKSTAPTRPHPMAPGGAAKKVADPGAAVVDRARDALEDR